MNVPLAMLIYCFPWFLAQAIARGLSDGIAREQHSAQVIPFPRKHKAA